VIEERLKKELNIPVFHDDQHGTAIIVLAGVMNALKLLGKKKEEMRVVVSGAGAAGVAVSKLLMRAGITDVILCDRKGVISKETAGNNETKLEMIEITNPRGVQGSLADALKEADIFVGVSAPGIVNREMVATMRRDPIIFAMSNPVPEIMPEEARAGGARVIGTGRSDFPNQVNNVLVFPGIFKGALEGHARQITEEMKLAAAEAVASLVDDQTLDEEHILPAAFDPRVADAVSRAVREHISADNRIF
jgi:malate dehydrogenase (oxaloacetate-decarboxylating)